MMTNARPASHEQLAELMVFCAEDNWDGHGASKISFGAVQHACWWLRQLPDDVPSPMVGVSTAGNVTLDWLGLNGHMVVVGCKANGDLSYAWANGEGTTALGTLASPMEWPKAILQLLRLLNGREMRKS